jgi:hypothetical protein
MEALKQRFCKNCGYTFVNTKFFFDFIYCIISAFCVLQRTTSLLPFWLLGWKRRCLLFSTQSTAVDHTRALLRIALTAASPVADTWWRSNSPNPVWDLVRFRFLSPALRVLRRRPDYVLIARRWNQYTIWLAVGVADAGFLLVWVVQRVGYRWA